MKRRTFLQHLGGAGLARTGVPPRRPNIVLMVADDLGFSDLGCYGGEIDTPNLDGLARRGVRFTQFYNAARCCPTRASLLTGLYPHQVGIGHMVETGRSDLPAYRGDLSLRAVTIAEALRAAGYHTLMVGKWHVTPVTQSRHNWPLERGFQHHYGTIYGAGSYYDPASLTRDNEPARPDRPDYYYTDAVAENAARYIEAYAAQGAPFFLYVAFTAPHWPLHAREADIAKYKGRYKQGWDALRRERHRRMIEMGLVDAHWPLTPRDPRVPAWEQAEHKEWQMRRMEVYAAMVDRMDQAVGRILTALRDHRAYDNTLILFLSDNGGCAEDLPVKPRSVPPAYIPQFTRDGRVVRRGNDPSILPGPEDTFGSYGAAWANASNTPFRLYKHWVHEGGIATPLIAHWPGRIARPGTLVDQPGHVIDIMVTCLEVAGAKYPSTRDGQAVLPLEGRSLVPILEGRRRSGHDAIFWEHEGNRAVRQGKWKLVSRYGGPWELYDMEADRTETMNLSTQRLNKTRELVELYEQWARRCGVVPWDKVRSAP